MVVHSTTQPVRLYVPRDQNWKRGLSDDTYPGAAWFLNLLHWKWICWRADDDGFVRLKSDYLRKVVPRESLSEIRNVLHDSGVIDWDHSYIKGNRSMRYRLCEPYRRTQVVECHDEKLGRKLRKLQRKQKFLPVHDWLKGRLTLLCFDRQRAESIISGMYPDDDSPLDVVEYQALVSGQVQRFDDQQAAGTPELTVCRYGRVHTAVTRLPVSLRQCLSSQGQPIVSIDLCNSQPLFAGLVALDYYSSRSKKRRLHEFESTDSKKQYGRARNPTQSTPTQPPITMAGKSYVVGSKAGCEGCLCDRNDLVDYFEACEQGEFYESLMQPGDDRGRIKRRTLIDFFFGKGLYESRIGHRVHELYPSISEMVTDLKKHDYRRPSWIMQNREATMFIGRIARRIMAECPDIPLATIHDSFLTTEQHADYIEAVAMQEFAKLGVQPTFKRESYI